MMEKKIVVPEGMMKAAYDAQLGIGPPTFEWHEADELTQRFYNRILEAALRWLSENPIVPTEEQSLDMEMRINCENHRDYRKKFAVEWQRRMFLAEATNPRRERIIEVLKQYPDRAPEIADKILAALEGE